MKTRASNVGETFFQWSLFAITAAVTYGGSMALLIG
jgi:hypothetical protein